jgi:hypothetical protein
LSGGSFLIKAHFHSGLMNILCRNPAKKKAANPEVGGERVESDCGDRDQG